MKHKKYRGPRMFLKSQQVMAAQGPGVQSSTSGPVNFTWRLFVRVRRAFAFKEGPATTQGSGQEHCLPQSLHDPVEVPVPRGRN